MEDSKDVTEKENGQELTAYQDGGSTLLETGSASIVIQQEDHVHKPRKCNKLRSFCHRLCKPVRTKYNPLPTEPSCLQRFKFALLCPPHGNLASYIQFFVLAAFIWMVLVSVTQDDALPGGNFFSLFILFFAAVSAGYVTSFVRLPPLLGMLFAGALLRNIPVVKIIGESIDHGWSGALRQIALTVILIRAGLGLDPKALRKLSFTVLRLAFAPCLIECCAEAVAAHLLLGFPWPFAFLLGFVLAAVSPAVVVPSLLGLSDRGYGLNKGIPTLIIAAASVDDVLSITGFGVVLGITFSTGQSIALALVKGPLEAVLGIVYGIAVGIFLWYIPSKGNVNLVLYRSILLLITGLTATFGSTYVHLSGAGPLGCLTLAFVAAFRWRQELGPNDENKMAGVVAILWMIFQPLLFGLIGSEVDIEKIDGGSVGLGMATLAIGLIIRLIVSFLVVFGSGLNWKEMFFVPVAWCPKATVQAAIGGIALDMARKINSPEDMIWGRHILTIAVLSIIVTAPIGAVAISILGPRLLHKTDVNAKKTDEVADEKRSMLEDEEKDVTQI